MKAKKRNELRILLMQIRKDEHIANQELTSFAHYAEIDKTQISVLNVYTTPYFDHSILNGFDSLWVGGASDANVLKPDVYPFVETAMSLLRYCKETGFPVFASCFGFQLATLALNGTIIDSDNEFEMGCLPISLKESACKDILFKDISNPFMAISVHKQKALSVPADCELLAFTDICVHAFKVKNQPFWAFQFHPEVDKKILIERLTFYRSTYTQGTKHLDQVLSNTQDTPESNKLMKKFVDRVLLE